MRIAVGFDHNVATRPAAIQSIAHGIDAIRRAGFDATHSKSALRVGGAPPGRPAAPEAAQRLAGIVYIPVGLHVASGTLRRLAGVVRGVAGSGRAAASPASEASA